jgi:glycine/D-amino acid oxidase-like deaminating enzyme
MEHRSALTDFCMESLALYPGFVEELQAESDSTIDYQGCGALDVAFTAAEWTALEARAVRQREFGIRSEALDARALAGLRAITGREAAGALRFPDDAVVNPRQVMDCLQVGCARRGVAIWEQHRVSAVHLRGTHIEVDSAPGIFSAACVVLAAGAWSGEIAVWRDGERLPLAHSFPVKGHLLGYRLEAGSLGTILRHGSTYILQRANGFTVAGSSSERVGFERGVDPAITADIHTRACAVVPRLRQAPPPEPWIGFRPAIESLEPEIRRLAGTNLWLAYGHYRNGILLAPATARRVSDDIIANWEKDSTSPGGSR